MKLIQRIKTFALVALGFGVLSSALAEDTPRAVLAADGYTGAKKGFIVGTFNDGGANDYVVYFSDTNPNTRKTFTVATAGYAEILVVGGGGAGGNSTPNVSINGQTGTRGGGGGGAGGVVKGTVWLEAGEYSVDVGAGGTVNDLTGGKSQILFGSDPIAVAYGGGRGGTSTSGKSGASGGGGSGQDNNGGAVSSESSGAGNLGFAGGPGQNCDAGGGGGAGAAGTRGQWASNTEIGQGGRGIASSITGHEVWYAGGGGGGNRSYGNNGGKGGGGASNAGGGIANPGTDELGGGGAGASARENISGEPVRYGGKGGSGVVIVRMSATINDNYVSAIVGNTDVEVLDNGTGGKDNVFVFDDLNAAETDHYFTLKQNAYVRILTVGGGGSGGAYVTQGGITGGGGGGQVIDQMHYLSAGTYYVVTGKGGVGAQDGVSTRDGFPSYVKAAEDAGIVQQALGGGGGGNGGQSGRIGANGGGGGIHNGPICSGGSGSVGFGGGSSYISNANGDKRAGGGGGAGAAGGTATASTFGTGGTGVYSDIRGLPESDANAWYGGGGAGGLNTTGHKDTTVSGGKGGGARAYISNGEFTMYLYPGENGKGGGGGGISGTGNANGTYSGNGGGCGTVIVRILQPDSILVDLQVTGVTSKGCNVKATLVGLGTEDEAARADVTISWGTTEACTMGSFTFNDCAKGAVCDHEILGLTLGTKYFIKATAVRKSDGFSGSKMTAVIPLAIDPTVTAYFVTPDATGGGNGKSWASPYTLQEAFAAIAGATAGTTNEIYMKVGTYTKTEGAWTATINPCFVRFLGGYTGVNFNRSQTEYSVLDGESARGLVEVTVKNVSTDGSKSILFDQIEFTRGKGAYKISNTGTVNYHSKFNHCRFIDNVVTTSDTTIKGSAIEVAQGMSWLCVENCEFRGNKSCTDSATTIYAAEVQNNYNCGLKLSHSLFVGNSTKVRPCVAQFGGSNFNNVEIKSCTFAYNAVATDANRSGAGATAAQGGLVLDQRDYLGPYEWNVSDTIFYGNRCNGSAGTDYKVWRPDSVSIQGTPKPQYLLFENTGAYSFGTVDAIAQHYLFADPKFVTSQPTVTFDTTTYMPNWSVSPADMDVHLQSTKGRWNGSEFVNDAVDSPAIDAGNPASEFAEETAPNGFCINLGVYGNTAEASRSHYLTATLTAEVSDEDSTAATVTLAVSEFGKDTELLAILRWGTTQNCTEGAKILNDKNPIAIGSCVESLTGLIPGTKYYAKVEFVRSSDHSSVPVEVVPETTFETPAVEASAYATLSGATGFSRWQRLDDGSTIFVFPYTANEPYLATNSQVGLIPASFTIKGSGLARLLVVGGGGAGGGDGWHAATGGGGGGQVVDQVRYLQPGTYNVAVGVGGKSPSGNGKTTTTYSGSPSSVKLSGSGDAELEALGGGGGGSQMGAGGAGANGGGGSVDHLSASAAWTAGVGGSGSCGFDGGAAWGNSGTPAQHFGGGGGGAGGFGGSAQDENGRGTGGIGLYSSILGLPESDDAAWFGGGGAGGARLKEFGEPEAVTGGCGGGGSSLAESSKGSIGVPGTGGGGSGLNSNFATSADAIGHGGSGIVVLRIYGEVELPVTLDLNDGTGINTNEVQVAPGETMPAVPKPTRPGYAFQGYTREGWEVTLMTGKERDIITNGTLRYAYSPASSSAKPLQNRYILNGVAFENILNTNKSTYGNVTFNPQLSSIDSDRGLEHFKSGNFDDPQLDGGGVPYGRLMRDSVLAPYDASELEITLGDLESGRTYLVQLVCHDRQVFIANHGLRVNGTDYECHTTTLKSLYPELGDNLIENAKNCFYGRSFVLRFKATGTTHTFTLGRCPANDTSANKAIQINALQVRDITGTDQVDPENGLMYYNANGEGLRTCDLVSPTVPYSEPPRLYAQWAEAATLPEGKQFVYNGAEQVGVPESDYYDIIEGVGTATAAGDYSVTLQPKAGYCWDFDGSHTNVVVNWSIARAQIASVQLSYGQAEYTGSEVSKPTVVSVTTVAGDVITSSAVGWTDPRYERNRVETPDFTRLGNISVVVTGTGNLTGEKAATFRIYDPTKVQLPRLVQTSYRYTGSAITPEFEPAPSADTYTLSGDVSKTQIGVYTVICTPKAGCTWENGQTGPYEVTWEIVGNQKFLERLASDPRRVNGELQTNYDTGLARGGDIVLFDPEACVYIHAFTNTADAATFTAKQNLNAWVLAVGGGGGGGSTNGGGGGAGGMIEDKNLPFAQEQSVSITIGAGAPGVASGHGSTGSQTQINIPGLDSIIAYGGGGGGCVDWHLVSDQNPAKGYLIDGYGGENVGSGGGAGGYFYGWSDPSGSGVPGRSITMYKGVKQGNDGGAANNNRSCPAGGGGGAGAAGETPDSYDSYPGRHGSGQNIGGYGGVGRASDILGFSQYFAGGGASGGNDRGSGVAFGGVGGGGNGAGYVNKGETDESVPKAQAGENGLGGGGGGGKGGDVNPLYNPGAAGGDGIVIIRYAATPPIPVAVPVAKTGLFYNGKTQVGVPEGVGYTLSDYYSTTAGTFTATATLDYGYVWEDGVTDLTRTIEWTILNYMRLEAIDNGSDPAKAGYVPLTGFKPKKDQAFAMTFSMNKELDTNTAQMLFAVQYSDSADPSWNWQWSFNYTHHGSPTKVLSYTHGKYSSSQGHAQDAYVPITNSDSVKTGGIHTAVLGRTLAKMSIDGETIKHGLPGFTVGDELMEFPQDFGNDLVLFCSANAEGNPFGTAGMIKSPALAKIYGFTVMTSEDDPTPVLDLVPVRRTDGVRGFYDLVNGNFYPLKTPVVLDGNGGEPAQQYVYTSNGEPMPALPNGTPTRAGFDFTGYRGATWEARLMTGKETDICNEGETIFASMRVAGTLNTVAFDNKLSNPDESKVLLNMTRYTHDVFNEHDTTGAYADLMKRAIYGNNDEGNPREITLKGLEINHAYLFQFFVHDGRGGNESDFEVSVDRSMWYKFGQKTGLEEGPTRSKYGVTFVYRFVATAATEKLKVYFRIGEASPDASVYPQFNGIQLRDITAVSSDDGMYYDKEGTPVKACDFGEGTTLYAQWEPGKYHVIDPENGPKIAVDPEWLNGAFGPDVNYQAKLFTTNGSGVVAWQAYVLGYEADKWNDAAIVEETAQNADPDTVTIRLRGMPEKPRTNETSRLAYSLLSARTPEGLLNGKGDVVRALDGNLFERCEQSTFEAPLSVLDDNNPVNYYRIKVHFIFNKSE